MRAGIGLYVTPNSQGFYDAIYARRKIDGTILSADSLRTSNYAEDGSGNATAGAKLNDKGSRSRSRRRTSGSARSRSPT